MTAALKRIGHLPGESPGARHPEYKAAGSLAGGSVAPLLAASIPPALSYGARLSPPDASRYLAAVWAVRRAPKTLAKLRCIGGGPEYQKAGRDVIYTRAALDSWATALLRPGGGDG